MLAAKKNANTNDLLKIGTPYTTSEQCIPCLGRGEMIKHLFLVWLDKACHRDCLV